MRRRRNVRLGAVSFETRLIFVRRLLAPEGEACSASAGDGREWIDA